MQRRVDCSVIIPIFNAEKTVSGVLFSLKDLCEKITAEIILVDDGSTDKSGFLCDEYAAKDKRIRVFHKENGGVSSARNLGLKEAKGKYIYFADSDDVVHTRVLEKMIAIADSSRADIVFANYETEELSSGIKTLCDCKIPAGDILGKDYIENTLLYKFYKGDNVGLSTLCNKLYSVKLINDNASKFDEKRAHGEDWAFNIKILQYAKRVAAINETVYTYRLDGTQNYNKYRKNLGYSLSNGYEIICGLNLKYKFVSENSFEAKRVAVGFLEQIAQYLKMSNVPKQEKRDFIRTDAVKKAMRKIRSIKNSELALYDISRRTKLAAKFILLGSIKLSMKIY